jgi:hypothetical protein
MLTNADFDVPLTFTSHFLDEFIISIAARTCAFSLSVAHHGTRTLVGQFQKNPKKPFEEK